MFKTMLSAGFVIAAALSVTACVVSVTSEEKPTVRAEVSGRPATCDAARYQTLINQPVSAIDRTTLPKEFRIVCDGCPMTMDYRTDRLTIILDKASRVASASCS